MLLPNDFNKLATLLYDTFNLKNILIVNTPNTGVFLDKIFTDKNPKRIKYTANKFDEFITNITNIIEKFDLILVDPYHEYKESIITFKVLTKLLDENGILISHDCFPPNFESTYPYYIKNIKGNWWCGVTYAAFIENAYNNQDLYYGIINKDFGLGIISKKEIQYVKKIIDNEKQQIFLELFKNKKYKKAYDYFKQYSNNIINLISN